MIIGLVNEIRNNEHRVGLTPCLFKDLNTYEGKVTTTSRLWSATDWNNPIPQAFCIGTLFLTREDERYAG